MSDLISESVLRALIMDKYPTRDIEGIRDGILNVISRAPRAKKRQSGEWEKKDVFPSSVIEEMQSARCSACGKFHTTPYLYYFDEYNFCPNCGAKMRKETE